MLDQNSSHHLGDGGVLIFDETGELKKTIGCAPLRKDRPTATAPTESPPGPVPPWDFSGTFRAFGGTFEGLSTRPHGKLLKNQKAPQRAGQHPCGLCSRALACPSHHAASVYRYLTRAAARGGGSARSSCANPARRSSFQCLTHRGGWTTHRRTRMASRRPAPPAEAWLNQGLRVVSDAVGSFADSRLPADFTRRQRPHRSCERAPLWPLCSPVAWTRFAQRPRDGHQARVARPDRRRPRRRSSADCQGLRPLQRPRCSVQVRHRCPCDRTAH